MNFDEERIRLVARAATDALWDWDLRTDEVWWSEGFENLFGFSDNQSDRHLNGWAARIHPDDRERVLSGLRAAARNQRGWADSYRFRCKDGTYVQVLDRGYVLREPDGTPVRMIGGMSDITRHQATTEMLDEVNRQLRALSAQVLRAQEEERARIARELHDELGQILTLVKMRMMSALQADPQEARTQMQTAVREIEAGIEAVRRLSLDLHPPQLMQFGLASAINGLLQREIPEDGPTFALESNLGDLKLERMKAITAFRVVQEAITNALRHAEADHIDIHLDCKDGVLEICVRDDGKGFDMSSAKRKALEGQATGLIGLRERLQLVGGKLSVSSAPGAGCEVRAQLPLRGEL